MELCQNLIVIFAGKDGSRLLNDLITVDIETMDMKLYNTKLWNVYPSPRYRHASAVFSEVGSQGETKQQHLFIDGGRNFEKSFGDSFAYDVVANKWVKVRMTGEILPVRHSHSLCPASDTSFYLTGGLINDSEFQINTCLYLLNFAELTCLVSVQNRNLPPIFGHTSHVYKQEDKGTRWLILVGGIVPYCPYSMVTLYDLENHCVKIQLRVGGDCLMSNHTSHIVDGELLCVVGGGGFMSNFGIFYNRRVKSFSLQEMVSSVNTVEKFPSLDNYVNVKKEKPAEKKSPNDTKPNYEQNLYFEKQDS